MSMGWQWGQEMVWISSVYTEHFLSPPLPLPSFSLYSPSASSSAETVLGKERGYMLRIVEKEARASPCLAMILLGLSDTSLKRWQVKNEQGHTVCGTLRAELRGWWRRNGRDGCARTCAVVAGGPRACLLCRKPHGRLALCVSTLGSRRMVSPSSGKSLSPPFLSRKRESLESRSTVGKPSFGHSCPSPAEQGPSPGLPFSMRLSRATPLMPLLLLSV